MGKETGRWQREAGASGGRAARGGEEDHCPLQGSGLKTETERGLVRLMEGIPGPLWRVWERKSSMTEGSGEGVGLRGEEEI